MAETKQYGLTPPMAVSQPLPLDFEKNAELIEELKRENNYETKEATDKRISTLKLLDKVNREFIKTVSARQGIPQNQLAQLGGKIYTYGSYKLGVYGPGSDIDTLAVAPKNVRRDDFFELFPDILRKHASPGAITSLTAVPEAFVPIIKLVLHGIEIDLIFASIASKQTIHEKMNLGDNKILDGLDDSTIKSVTGPRVSDEVLASVPEQKYFRTALRAIKLWAQRRAIYANIIGFPGGIAWAILVARICQLYPKAIGATIVQKFFFILKSWHWPAPIQLKDIETGPQKTWNPKINTGDRKNLIPIITPAYPSMCTTYNVSQSTKAIVVREIERGSKISADIFDGKAKWADLFKKHTFFTQDHKYYLSVIATARDPDDAKAWSGAVESRIRHLVNALDLETKMIKLARPFTKGFKRIHKVENDDQIREVQKGEMKYKVEETKIVESTDPDLVAANAPATATNNDDAAPAKVEGGITLYTYTYYVGMDPTEHLEQTKSLNIAHVIKQFKDRCYQWEKVDSTKHYIDVVPCKSWMLPDDVFDEKSGEVKPTKPSKKRKAANGDTPLEEPPIKRVDMNGTAAASRTPDLATPVPA